MPRYVCSECGEVFDSKEARENHSHEGAGSSLRIPTDFSIPDLTLNQMAVLGGVFLMATLFMGTAFFYSSTAPASPGSSGGGSLQESSPPVGHSIQSQSDVPGRGEADLPSGAVSEQQLSTETQIYLLTRPAVLLQYSCVDCPETVSELEKVASDFNVDRNWVYVAPYTDMNATIAMTAYRRSAKLDSFDRSRAESFICSNLNDRPVPCAFR